MALCDKSRGFGGWPPSTGPRGMSRRAGIYEALEDRFKACQFETEQEALEAMQAVDELRKEADKSNERSLAIVQKSLFEEVEVEAGLE